MSKKILVAYFSAGGVTAQTAQKLAQAADADLYEITPETPYTKADLDWMNKQSRSSLEMADKSSRPAIAGKPLDISAYKAVFVGFPIWWGIAPTIVNTFLEKYDFSGKTVIAFATSGGSGMGRTDENLKPSCSASTSWRAGRLLNGMSEADMKQWIAGLKL